MDYYSANIRLNILMAMIWVCIREMVIITVNCVLDLGNPVKTKHLLDLPRENERLTLWKADLDDEGSFDAVVDGCEGVFHVATPMDFESEDPEVWLSFLCASDV